jgi:hypothetical protein
MLQRGHFEVNQGWGFRNHRYIQSDKYSLQHKLKQKIPLHTGFSFCAHQHYNVKRIGLFQLLMIDHDFPCAAFFT